MKKSRAFFWLLLPFLLGSCMFMVVPFLEVLRRSVTLGTGGQAKFVGLTNFKNLWNNALYALAVRNTAVFFLISLPVIMFLGFAIALMLQKLSRRTLLQSALLMPCIMPVLGAVTVLDFLAALFPGYTGFQSLGASICIYLWKCTGYTALTLTAGLVTIPREQYESAQMDGAGFWNQLFRITLPQMGLTVFYSLVFSVMNGFRVFREIYVVGGQHPSRSLYMLQHFLLNCFTNLSYSKMSCCAVLLVLTLLVPFSLLFLYLNRKEEGA